MKKLVFLLMLLFTQVFPQAGWIEMLNLPSTADFKSIKFVDSTTGWVAGETGVIISTTNGGVNWTLQTTGTIKNLNCVHFIDHLHGCAVGDSGTVLRTSDGGANWVKSSFITKQKLHTVFFVDVNNGWIAGDSGAVFKTTNSGLNWINCSIGSIYPIKSIFFNNPNNGWLVDLLTIWRTTDSGLGWLSNANITGLNSVFFTDFSTGWVVGSHYIPGLDNGIVYKTSNGGQNWLRQQYKPTEYFYSVSAIDSNNAWIAGRFGGILKTTDGGANWLLRRLHFNNSLYHLYSVCFSDLLHGWVVGAGGAVFRTTDGGTVSIDDETQLIEPKSLQLYQNYPNPFNPSTKIKYSIPTSPLNPSPYQGEGNRERFVTLKVYDILGNEIETLINEEKSPGSYEVTWNAVSLPSGVYFYQLRTGSIVNTKKMILMH